MGRTRPFGDETFESLIELVAGRTPTPGGGTVAALANALGAALACMAVRFSIGRKTSTPESDAVASALELNLVDLGQRFLRLADEDSDAFERVRSARKLPQTTPAEVAARATAIEAATQESAAVPLRTMRLARDGLEVLDGATGALNPNLATDAASGALLMRAGARCAALNVRVNLVGDDSPGATTLREEVETILLRCAAIEERVASWVDSILGKT